jgi:uncharacterized protein
LPGAAVCAEMAAVNETLRVCFRPSPIHGTGGFARADIPRATAVLEYVGRLVSKPESVELCREGNEYIFRLDEETDLDGNVDWNPARFLNHSCAPNCEAELIDGRIWIVALRDIGAGEEITFDYGYDLEDYWKHPCCCGAGDCAGFIVAEALREEVRKRERARGALDSVPV